MKRPMQSCVRASYLRSHMQAVNEPSAALVPRLWTTFAMVWLLVLVITAGQLVREPLPPGRHAITLVDVCVLAALYVWLTLRIAPTNGEDEPRREISIVARFAAVAVMTLLVVPLIYLVPKGGMWWHAMYAVVA